MPETINPNDLPHDPDTGKPIYPKAAAEELPVGTKHLDDGSKRLPDGKVIASPSAVEGPPNPNDLEKDEDGKLTPESQAIIAAYQAKNSPTPKPDKPKPQPKAKAEPKAEPQAETVTSEPSDAEPEAAPKVAPAPKAKAKAKAKVTA